MSTNNLQPPMDLAQLIQTVTQQQQQLSLLTERVQQHDHLLTRLNLLEKENEDLKKLLSDKDQELKKLQQGLATSHVTNSVPARTQGGEGSSTTTATTTANATTSFASIAMSAAAKPDPKKKAKKRLAAGRAFTTADSKGKQGYQYVYIGRSRKILRSEVRKHLDNSGIDLGRVLDICFPASHIIG
ncbi:hypothetical protein MBANPS3_012670, partial [Mucor bainieri]